MYNQVLYNCILIYQDIGMIISKTEHSFLVLYLCQVRLSYLYVDSCRWERIYPREFLSIMHTKNQHNQELKYICITSYSWYKIYLCFS